MKKLLTLSIFVITLSTTFAQTTDKVASTPALNHDWREGFMNITELNAGMGLGVTDVPYSKSYFGITTVNGYQFSRNIKAGIGIGIQRHNAGTLFPLYFDGRYSFNAQQYVPFLSAAGGWALSFKDLNGQSRIFINPSMGIRFVSMPKVSITFSTGIMMQSGGGEGRSSFVNFRLGLEFKGKEW